MHFLLILSQSLAETPFPHQEHLAVAEDSPSRNGHFVLPDHTVYGYHPYWGGSVLDIDLSPLSHIAVFNVELTATGDLIYTNRWTDVADTLVPKAHAIGVKVHLCFTSFTDTINNSVLPDPQKRERAILQLDALISSVDADGINVDIEGMDASQRLNLNLFISELKQVVPEVVIATPAIDWSNAYDYNTLASLSDGLFIMGYGYHWSGGDPGPVDPLNGNSPWSQYSLAWSVQDYINDGVPKDKIILGLPLYGRKWPTTNNTIPGTATGTGIPVIMNDAVVEASIMGSLYDTPSQTPYILYNNEQLWYGDVESVRERIRFAVSSDIQGIGFWALTYENGVSGFWEMVNQETTDIEPNDDTGQPDLSDSGTIPDTNDSGSIPDPNSPPIANAGEDQMVRVDQGASLFGSASSDPDGDAIQFTWRQVSGPSSTLNDDTTATPEVSFSESGEYEFELRVFDSEFYSNADSVIVEATAQSKETASCHAFPFWTPLWLSPLILLRRRKKHAHPRYYL